MAVLVNRARSEEREAGVAHSAHPGSQFFSLFGIRHGPENLQKYLLDSVSSVCYHISRHREVASRHGCSMIVGAIRQFPCIEHPCPENFPPEPRRGAFWLPFRRVMRDVWATSIRARSLRCVS